MTPFLFPLLSLLIAWGLSLLLASKYSPLRIHDAPNARSLHETPTPRTGGIAIVTAIAAGWGGLALGSHAAEALLWITAAALLVAAISLLDDLLDLPPLPRFLVHGVAALVLVAGGVVPGEGWLWSGVTLLFVVWMLNLYNFMDGMDGFAGGMTLLGFGFLGLAGWIGGSEIFALYCWTVAAAAAGFLLLNFPPARIFMGDTGSIPLGLLAAAFSAWGVREGLFPLWAPLLIFSPFIVDATVTLLRRLLRGERIWQAHRSHYYQRLVLSGWSHRRTVLAEYLLMAACGLSTLAMVGLSPWVQWVGIAAWCGIYLLLARRVDARGAHG